MKASTASTAAVCVVHVVNAVVTVAALVVISIMALTFFDFGEVSRLVADTRDLSSEMRLYSSEMTRFVRTYVVTGNRTYEQLYRQAADMRDGVAPLPSEPFRIWWDFVICCGAPRDTTAPKSLLDRLKASGITDKEIADVEEALERAKALQRVEDLAFAARMQYDSPGDRTFEVLVPNPTERELWFRTHSRAADPTAPARRDYGESAMTAVHGMYYNVRKAEVMRPIDSFMTQLHTRVDDRMDWIAYRGYMLVALQLVVIVLIVFTQVLFVVKISRDAAAASLLSTVLPGRIVDSVSLANFQMLRKYAAIESKKRAARSDHTTWLPTTHMSGSMGNPNGERTEIHFPALFTEDIPSAWVTFLDVVSFTPTCRDARVAKVIGMLNELFSLLDVEASYAGVEKIKTIGDAFLAVVLHHTGADLHGKQHHHGQLQACPELADGGMQMLAFLFRAFRVAEGVARPRAVQLPDGSWSSLVTLRAGLHAGPVAAGIVGFERPMYDVFGDTVNIAARLEAVGQPSAVMMLTNQLYLFGYHLQYLQVSQSSSRMDLKGVGSVDTTLVHGDEREAHMRPASAVLLHAPNTRLFDCDVSQLAPSAPYSVLEMAVQQEVLSDEEEPDANISSGANIGGASVDA